MRILRERNAKLEKNIKKQKTPACSTKYVYPGYTLSYDRMSRTFTLLKCIPPPNESINRDGLPNKHRVYIGAGAFIHILHYSTIMGYFPFFLRSQKEKKYKNTREETAFFGLSPFSSRRTGLSLAPFVKRLSVTGAESPRQT
jgi:hypothetical protein